MSIALMTEAWKLDIPAGTKLVLLALCDNANDAGECYPSISMLAKKCSMGERTVQQHITALEFVGMVSRDMRPARSTVYRIHQTAFKLPTNPADFAPRKNRTPQISHHTPADFAPSTPQNLHPTPAESAPITIKEPSIEPSRNQKKATPDAFVLPNWVPADAWAGFVEMREKKKKPLTGRARDLILKTLKTLQEGGHDIAAILDSSTVNNWTNVYAPKQEERRTPVRPYQTAADRGRAWSDRLSGVRHATDNNIIDITPANPVGLD